MTNSMCFVDPWIHPHSTQSCMSCVGHVLQGLMVATQVQKHVGFKMEVSVPR